MTNPVDPFAAAQPVADEAQVQPVQQHQPAAQAPTENPWEPPAAPEPVVVNNVSSADGDEKVRITLKSGNTQGTPWITVDFPSIDVAHTRLTDNARLGKLNEIFNVTARASTAFQTQVSGAPVPAPAAQAPQQYQPQAAPQQQYQQGQPPASAQAPGGVVKQCPHGQMTFRSGVKAETGKAWAGHFCPLPKGDPNQCRPDFGR